MSDDYKQWAESVRRLDSALRRLEAECRTAGVSVEARGAGIDLLRKKLLPQLDSHPALVVSVVGGTNIGKSALFNQLAGERASAVSPLAAGTKHPVCLVPSDFADPEILGQWFADFHLCRWQSAEDPLQESHEHRMFWQVGANVPSPLVLVDAPDVDSDMPVNWDRARAIRDASDVLVAVLTQQKYNDAAVKQFFREAARADKPVLVVFNQCDLSADAAYWPMWLETFCQQTGIAPEWIYVVPHDRPAIDELRLPFYRIEPQQVEAPSDDAARAERPGVWLRQAEPADPRGDLAALRFDQIKIRTFRGAVRRVCYEQGSVREFLDRATEEAQRYRTAAETLGDHLQRPKVQWPGVPAAILVDEIRRWWDAGRPGWSRKVFTAYRFLGNQVRRLWDQFREPTDAAEEFQQREHEVIVDAVSRLLDELDRLAAVGNDILRPRLQRILSGKNRQTLLAKIEAAHAQLPPVDDDYRRFLREELDRWSQKRPEVVRWLRWADNVGAVARPAVTVTLLVSGWGLAGGLVGQAGHAAGEALTEAAVTTGMTAAGETALAAGSEGMMHWAGRLFFTLQAEYARNRADWLAQWLEQNLLGELLGELQHAAELPQGDAFAAVERTLSEVAVTSGV